MISINANIDFGQDVMSTTLFYVFQFIVYLIPTVLATNVAVCLSGTMKGAVPY